MASEEKDVQQGAAVNPGELAVPEVLPLLPLQGFVFYPGMGFPLQVASPTSRALVDDALLGRRLIGLVPVRTEQQDDSALHAEDFYRVGVVGYVHKINKEQNLYQILVSGTRKFAIESIVQETPYLRARVHEVPMDTGAATENRQIEALLFNIKSQFKKLVAATELPQELVSTADSLDNPFYVAYLVASQLHLKLPAEQEILEIEPLEELLRRVAAELHRRMETVQMSQQLQDTMKKDMDKRQREFYLRQQLAAIRKELGEDEDDKAELRELREKIEAKRLPEHARAAADRELGRLERISPASPEYSIARSYLDWILDLPWLESSPEALDLDKARSDLDADHSGLEKIKKRILEFLAVRKLKADLHGPILCFVGPPGVGKTSLGQSIARTLGRNFVRIALGGVHDEAEIRGHRRTYVGALPGRIIASLKKAGSNNPVFLLDEVDKLAHDYHGDPSSALLEVLDPEQNATFTDHYLAMEFDLSRVMFIATANVLDAIPGPLRDRMEIVELSGYTRDEKATIAQKHLVPKQLAIHGLDHGELVIRDEAVLELIDFYTREAGVRGLEREIAALCRGAAAKIAGGHRDSLAIGAEEVSGYLGPQRFIPEMKTRTWGPGLATGLAWTPVGGEILFIESSKMPGSGRLSLTGKLGEVMKESANAALTYIRAHAEMLGLDPHMFADIDLHVHVPEGAIPKDGPSAGLAMVASLYSALSGASVRQDLAMTGEITLRGDILAVGGISEKVLAALRAGIRELVLPPPNEKDVMEIPAEIRKDVTCHYLHTIREALDILFTDAPFKTETK